jgi:DNA-binding CsgD family transcriptional regulator
LAFEADLAEALVHVGSVQAATSVVDAFERRAAVVGRAPVLAAAARCRGLMSTDDAWARHFDDALTMHEASPTPFERARTHLCFGERLRRTGRRTDARGHLRTALATFQQLGAVTWSERAAAELRASGETHRSVGADQLALTPREQEIALRVAAGATNKEIAATLFITAKTVEFHLGNVYRKLGVRSRVELAQLLLRAGGFVSGSDPDRTS